MDFCYLFIEFKVQALSHFLNQIPKPSLWSWKAILLVVFLFIKSESETACIVNRACLLKFNHMYHKEKDSHLELVEFLFSLVNEWLQKLLHCTLHDRLIVFLLSCLVTFINLVDKAFYFFICFVIHFSLKLINHNLFSFLRPLLLYLMFFHPLIDGTVIFITCQFECTFVKVNSINSTSLDPPSVVVLSLKDHFWYLMLIQV